MRKNSRQGLLLCLMFIILSIGGILRANEGSVGSDGLGDPFFANLGNGGYDVQHYTLDLNYNFDTETLAGTVTIEAIADESLSAFNLDFLGMNISNVQVNALPAVDFSRQNRELTIIPALPLMADEPFTVSITYHGIPGRNTKLPVFAQGW